MFSYFFFMFLFSRSLCANVYFPLKEAIVSLAMHLLIRKRGWNNIFRIWRHSKVWSINWEDGVNIFFCVFTTLLKACQNLMTASCTVVTLFYPIGPSMVVKFFPQLRACLPPGKLLPHILGAVYFGAFHAAYRRWFENLLPCLLKVLKKKINFEETFTLLTMKRIPQYHVLFGIFAWIF